MNKKKKEKTGKKSKIPKKRRQKIGEILGIIASIVAILALAFQITDIKFPVRSKPKVDIMEGSISLEYLQSLRRDEGENVYPLFNNTIENTNTNKFEDNCATQIFVANDYEEEIVLSKIMFEAKNISVNTRPVLWICQSEDETNFDLSVTNIGWGDSQEMTFQFEDVRGENIDDYLDSKKKELRFPGIAIGETKELHLWEYDNFLKEGEFEINFKCFDSNGDIKVKYLYGESLYVNVRDGMFWPLELGDPSAGIYGIEINTSENSYKTEMNISEPIDPHGRLELPICFSADKSCDFEFRVGFEVRKKNNDIEKIWTKPAKMQFEISSIGPNFENAENYSKEELTQSAEEWPGEVKVTYPYIDKDALKYVEPLF